jgi:hypothetical protein
MSVANDLSNVEVLDLDAQPVRLGSVWRDKTTVLVFIRHYG